MERKVSRAKLLTEKLVLPSELVPGVPRVTLHGSGQVSVENHGGIRIYPSQCVEVRTRDGLLRICGDGLQLAAMTREEIVVSGLIVSVEYC